MTFPCEQVIAIAASEQRDPQIIRASGEEVSSAEHPKLTRGAEQRSFVYFVEAVGADAVKIGFAINPHLRLAELQCGCPHELRLLVTIKGGAILERRLHAKYARLHVRGEWFRLADELAVDIREMCPMLITPLSLRRAELARMANQAAEVILRAQMEGRSADAERLIALVGAASIEFAAEEMAEAAIQNQGDKCRELKAGSGAGACCRF